MSEVRKGNTDKSMVVNVIIWYTSLYFSVFTDHHIHILLYALKTEE